MELLDFNFTSTESWSNDSIGNTTDPGWLPPNVSRSNMAVVMWYIHLYCTPPIIVIGLVGNLLSFLVFTCTNQKHLSSSVYLAALAVVDSAFLLQLMLLWPTYLRIFVVHTQGLCQLVIYLSYVASFLSVWLVVAFTVERFIVCMAPLQRSTMCTTSRAKAVVASLSMSALLAYSYNTWTSNVVVNAHSHKECTVRPQFQALVDVISLIDSFVTLVLPVVGIVIMNMKIILKVLDFEKSRKSMIPVKKQSVNSSHSSGSQSSLWDYEGPGSKRNQSARSRSQMKVTKMLLVVSTIFLVLNVPSHAVRVYDTFQTFFNPNYRPSKQLYLWQQVFTFLFNCNFSVNFFLYSFCGTSFRKALSDMMKRFWFNIRHCVCCGRSANRDNGRDGSPFRFTSMFNGPGRTDITAL